MIMYRKEVSDRLSFTDNGNGYVTIMQTCLDTQACVDLTEQECRDIYAFLSAKFGTP